MTLPLMWSSPDRVWRPLPPQPPTTLLGPAWDKWVNSGREEWERYRDRREADSG